MKSFTINSTSCSRGTPASLASDRSIHATKNVDIMIVFFRRFFQIPAQALGGLSSSVGRGLTVVSDVVTASAIARLSDKILPVLCTVASLKAVINRGETS